MHAHTHILVFTFMTVLLPAVTACDMARQEERPSSTIGFAASPLTKSVVENEEDMHEFAVWGYQTPAGGNGADVNSVFNCEKVYRAGAGSADDFWTYDRPRYWTEGNYSFYALHPFPDEGSGVMAACSPDGFTSIELDSPAADIDLMTAAAVREYRNAAPDHSSVAFNFMHLLSRVSVQVETGYGDISITSLTFSGVHDSGRYNGSIWDISGQTADGIFCLPAENSPLNIVPGSPVPVLQNLLLIPQMPGNDCRIVLDWTLDGTEQKQVTVSVPENPIWEPGKQYVYTIKLNNSQDVILNINVLDWEDENYSMDFNDWQ